MSSCVLKHRKMDIMEMENIFNAQKLLCLVAFLRMEKVTDNLYHLEEVQSLAMIKHLPNVLLKQEGRRDDSPTLCLGKPRTKP